MNPIISASEWKVLLRSQPFIILDARTGKTAREEYLNHHIAGARFIDLDKDLAQIGEDAAEGGRHPLPEIDLFGQTLEKLGVTKEAHVIVYDTANGANAAARCWWMLRAFGIEKVQVLSGGLQAAEQEGFAFRGGAEKGETTKITAPKDWQWPTANIEEVEREIAENTAVVIDVRDAYRYRGESEPIDLVAGHIPGAINIPFSENLSPSGAFLPAAVLKEKYTNLLKNHPSKIIVHCGSGVTACHTLLALDYAGFKVPFLYVGSWSEWSRREGKERAKEG